MKRAVLLGLVWSVAAVAHGQGLGNLGAGQQRSIRPNPQPIAPQAQAKAPAQTAPCSVTSKAGDKYSDTPLPGFNPAATLVTLVVPPSISGAVIVVCARSTIVPELTDYRVLTEMHLPMAIKEGKRVLVLGVADGKLQTTIQGGELKPAETEAVNKRIGEMQPVMDAQVAAGP